MTTEERQSLDQMSQRMEQLRAEYFRLEKLNGENDDHNARWLRGLNADVLGIPPEEAARHPPQGMWDAKKLRHAKDSLKTSGRWTDSMQAAVERYEQWERRNGKVEGGNLFREYADELDAENRRMLETMNAQLETQASGEASARQEVTAARLPATNMHLRPPQQPDPNPELKAKRVLARIEEIKGRLAVLKGARAKAIQAKASRPGTYDIAKLDTDIASITNEVRSLAEDPSLTNTDVTILVLNDIDNDIFQIRREAPGPSPSGRTPVMPAPSAVAAPPSKPFVSPFDEWPKRLAHDGPLLAAVLFGGGGLLYYLSMRIASKGQVSSKENSV